MFTCFLQHTKIGLSDNDFTVNPGRDVNLAATCSVSFVRRTVLLMYYAGALLVQYLPTVSKRFGVPFLVFKTRKSRAISQNAPRDYTGG